MKILLGCELCLVNGVQVASGLYMAHDEEETYVRVKEGGSMKDSSWRTATEEEARQYYAEVSWLM